MESTHSLNAGTTGGVELHFQENLASSLDAGLQHDQVHPEISKGSTISKWGLSSVNSWIDSELSKSSVDGYHGWDKKGSLVHTLQAQKFGDLSSECMRVLRKKQGDVQSNTVPQKEDLKRLTSRATSGAKPCKLSIPRLDLQSIDPSNTNIAQSARVDWERSENSWNDSSWSDGAFSERSLRAIVTDRDSRRQWLYDTRELSKEHALEPFATTRPPPIPPKLLKEAEIDKEASAVRHEARRISRVLHGVNVELMKRPGNFKTSSNDALLHNRSQQLRELREDIQQVNQSVRSIAYSLGAPLERPSRFDFVSANMYSLDHNRLPIMGARKLRQSIEFQDRIESVLVRNTEKQIEKYDDIARALRRRERQ